jgi:putative restriction endonuclease
MQNNKKSLKYYLHKLTHIRVNTSKKNGISPHKPVLILSIIGLIEVKHLQNNRIFITPELVAMFKSVWSYLVENSSHHCIFALPFYHLSTSGFWKLVAKQGCENMVQSKIAMKSFSNLETVIEYAEIDNELFELLNKKEEREVLKHAILDRYFLETKNNISVSGSAYINDIENDILNDTAAKYKAKLQKLQSELQNDSFEEEKYLRSNIFKRQIPILYDNTCAISGLQINATINVSLIDACHIIPFCVSYDDTVTNGISLTPTLHRAFDRGLIAIDENYKVIISDKFNENSESKYSITQFEGTQILLPKNKKYYPNIENLIWHKKIKFDL